MAFYDYIILDSKYYRTTHKTWTPEVITPMLSRGLLNGNLDATYGPASWLMWSGEVIAPATASGSYGTIADLETTLKKKATVGFTDHYGTAYTAVHLIGPFPKRSLSPNWDVSDNPIYVQIKIKAKAA